MGCGGDGQGGMPTGQSATGGVEGADIRGRSLFAGQQRRELPGSPPRNLPHPPLPPPTPLPPTQLPPFPLSNPKDKCSWVKMFSGELRV